MVTRATSDKREIRDLLSRNERNPSTHSIPSQQETVVPTNEVQKFCNFSAFIRHARRLYCCSTDNGAAHGDVVWCADSDGAIRARRADDGTVLPHRAAIPAIPNVHVNDIIEAATGDVWVACSDAYVRVYSTTKNQKIFEKRRQCGAVLCLTADTKYVFSGSEDFTIVVWDAFALRPVAHFQSHINYVRCLTTHRGYLYSAGADGTIRSWSIADLSEVLSAPFPLRPRSRAEPGIIGLFIMDDFLFVTTKETVLLYRSPTGELAHTISLPPAHATTAIIAAHPCESTVTLWLSLADGNILLYDLFNYAYLSGLSEHRNTVVPSIVTTGRTTVNHVLVLDGDQLTMFSAPSGSIAEGPPFSEAFLSVEEELSSRSTAVAKNADQLCVLRARRNGLRSYDQALRLQASKAIASLSQSSLLGVAAAEQMLFVDRRRDMVKRTAIADFLAATNAHLRLAFIAYAAWVRLRGVRSARSIREKLCVLIARGAERAVVHRHIRAILAADLTTQALHRRVKRADILCYATLNQSRFMAFFSWKRFANIQRVGRRRLDALHRHAQRLLIVRNKHATWTECIDVASRQTYVNQRANIAHALLRNSHSVLQRKWLLKWSRFRATRNIRRRQRVLATILLNSNEKRLARRFMMLLLQFSKARITSRLTKSTADLESKISEIDAVLRDPDLRSEAELDAAIASANSDLGALRSNILSLQAKVTACDSLTRHLEYSCLDGRADGTSSSSVATASRLANTRLFNTATVDETSIGEADTLLRNGTAVATLLRQKINRATAVFNEAESATSAKDRWSTMCDKGSSATADSIKELRVAVSVWEMSCARETGTAAVGSDATTDSFDVPWLLDIIKCQLAVEENSRRDATARDIEHNSDRQKAAAASTEEPSARLKSSSNPDAAVPAPRSTSKTSVAPRKAEGARAASSKPDAAVPAPRSTSKTSVAPRKTATMLASEKTGSQSSATPATAPTVKQRDGTTRTSDDPSLPV